MGKKLGKGLEALLNIQYTNQNIDIADKDLQYLPINNLIVGKYQPRMVIDSSLIEQLAFSIKNQGLLQPIVVRFLGSDSYEIIAGERRWRAAKLAGLEKIPAIIKNVSDEEVASFALIENLQREDLNPIEEANGYKRLIEEFKLTHEEVAKRVGKSRAAITNSLRLLNLHDDVKKLLQEGKLEMGHARALLVLSDIEQLQIAKIIAEKDLSVRAAEKLVKNIKNPVIETPRPPVELLKWADGLSTHLSNKLPNEVKIKVNNKGEGKLIINFSAPDEIDWFVKKFLMLK